MALKLPFLFGALLLLVACSAERGEERAFVLRDSADIVIVESRQAALGLEAWTVARPPVLSIGGARSEHLVHPVDAIRLNDGRIIVADEWAQQVKFFSPDGELIRAVGREGEGPGEFRSPWEVTRFRGDSLMVYDRTADRVSILDSDGSFGRFFPLRFGSNYWARGVVQDSMVFLWSPGEGQPRRDITGIYWDSTWFALYQGADRPVDTIGRYPRGEERGLGAGVPKPYHFEHRMSFALGGRGFYLGLGTSYEVGEYTLNGGLVRLIRRSFSPDPVTGELKRRFREGYIRLIEREEGDVSPEQLDEMLPYVNDADYPDRLPAYSDMIVDELGNLWVENYRIFTDPTSTWTVFGRDGRWVTTVRTPEGLRLSEIGADYVLGLAPDEMGAGRVRLYRLVK